MAENKSCETCAHSSRYTVTGGLLCLGPAPVIFCENVEQPCECWEKAEEKDSDEHDTCYNCDHAFRGIAYDGTDELYCCASGEDPVCVSDVKVCPGFKQKKGDKPNE